MLRQRWLGLITAGGLLLLILMIPTLIVVPFTGSNEVNQATETQAVEKKAELPSKISPFSVKVLRSKTNKVEEVPLETYVARVVASEMPVNFELEALKAQALAARTYITRDMIEGKPVSNHADVTDTTGDQVYKNDQELRSQWKDAYAANMAKINKAVHETSGEIITYDGQPIYSAFFSTSNGYTENSEDYWSDDIPYLKSVASPWDLESPKFKDQKIITTDALDEALGVAPTATIQGAKITKTAGKRVDHVTIGGKSFSGREIRETFNLRSSDFTLQQKGNHIIFTTKGYGHGVGMSQYGANGMAKAGKDYKEIIHHYYQETKISPLSKQTALADRK
ncbi:stage II sporulation protein D [Halobacillus salinarum]|uniref:Stage II sporulation protein D n=1 Tax=Halobacillus salinarum TaxID=2932257 RepID=A0ABY4ENF5_9BACI|nr:stage II sporulation protein D [Halobacillus salinarum]UOQ45363.1 stage II sporulation protein D [Halobacillus salinarum]